MQLTLIHNAFDTNDKSLFELEDKFLNAPIYSVLYEHIKEFNNKSYDVLFSINGVITENLAYKIQKTDHIAVIPIPAGGGGGGAKDVLRVVALVALVVVAPYAAAAAIGATGVAVSAAGFYAIQAGIMIAGGLLINALFPVQTPNLGTTTNYSDISPTYSFSGGSNARQEGTAIPIILGKARIVPPIISSYLSLAGDKQYINMLMALSDGEFDAIHSFQINNQDSSNFNDVYYYTRMGTNDQTVINNFSDNITTISDGRSINVANQEIIYTTTSNAVNELQIGFLLPKGLFYIQDDGTYVARTISANVKFRKVGETAWNDAPIYSQIQPVAPDASITKILLRMIDYAESIAGEEALQTASTQLKLSNTYKTAKRIVMPISNLEYGQYEIQIIRTSSYDTNTRVANDLQLEYVNEVTYDDLTYPNTGLLSVNAMATDQLSGSFPVVSAIVENTYLRYWENNSVFKDETKRLDNPAWACYYILKKAGFDNDNIDIAKFQEWADYCDTKSYKCNLILDTKMELTEILNMISPLGRARVIQMGTKWSAIVDKPEALPTQSFLFTSANIIEKSFALDYVTYTDRSNIVEVTYYDENNEYQATTVQAQSHNFDNTLDEYKTEINYYGCTSKDMAASYAQFLINQNRYITETVSFNVSIDALACNVGDIIKVGKKYLTNNEADGRIVSVDGDTLILDDYIVIDNSKSYTIEIRKSSDDQIYVLDIDNSVSGFTKEVTLVNPTTTFNTGDVYTIGETGLQSNLYRVISLTRNSDFERKISAIEYVSEVYDDTLIIPDEEVNILYTINALTAIDNSIRNEDGTVTDKLLISWQTRGIITRLPIYINNSLVGYSETNEFVWNEPDRDQVYTIKVGDNAITHTYLGTLSQLDAVTNIKDNFSNGVIYLTWDRNTEPDFDHYEVLLKGRTYRLSDNSLSLIDLDIGTYEFRIYAVNTSKVKSDVTIYSLVVRQPTLMFSIRDSYLIEQAFLDGLITIFTSQTAPVANQKYDLWKVDINSIEVDDLTYNSAILEDVTWEEGQDYNLYKYWNGNEWIFCTPDQIAVARRMLGQLTEAGIDDDEVKIFSIQPYTPYEVNDLWLNGTEIRICTTSRASGSYVSTDWESTAKDSLTVSTKLENVILTS